MLAPESCHIALQGARRGAEEAGGGGGGGVWGVGNDVRYYRQIHCLSRGLASIAACLQMPMIAAE